MKSILAQPNVLPMPAFDPKREVALHYAADLLAKASQVKAGETAVTWNQRPMAEREWFRQTAREVIDTFLLKAYGVELPKPEQPADTARESARFEAILQQRSLATVRARERGHTLSAFARMSGAVDEEARCERCDRSAKILVTLTCDERLLLALDGPALLEGCLVDAEAQS